jgi:negative regulator of replication initiation
MRSIRISDPVHRYIENRGKFGENYDDVLRRLFKLPPSEPPPSSLPPFLEAIPSTTSVNHRPRRNVSTREMRARVIGTTLSVGFEHEAPQTWELPKNKSDQHEIRRVRDLAVEYAVGRGATDGQRNAVGKAISEAGYYLTRRRTRK